MQTSIDLVIPAYNVVGTIENTLQRISEQRLPDGCQLQVYVFNDASTDATGEVLAALQVKYDFLRVISAKKNAGRSEARNGGAAAGTGSIIIMCDADCRYTGDGAIIEFVREIDAGADVVIGAVETTGDGFWSRYTNSMLPQRVEEFEDQGLVAFATTVNIAIRRSTFETLGGYSKLYRKYGFEDKDFLIRLDKLTSNVSLRPDIRVTHDSDFTLADVCRKSAEAGEYSAPIFREEHAEEYKSLPYRRCDAGSGGVRTVMRPASGLLRKLTQLIGAFTLSMPLPFTLKRTLVRVALCAAYFDGTARHQRSLSQQGG